MPLNPGNETITFVHVETMNGTPARYGVIPPLETSSVVRGCTIQPVSQKDRIADTVYSETTNVCITPTTDFTLSIVADDYLRDANGVKYRIIGPRPYRDGQARTDHITFLCKYEVG